jgi:hypothetical protein
MCPKGGRASARKKDDLKSRLFSSIVIMAEKAGPEKPAFRRSNLKTIDFLG